MINEIQVNDAELISPFKRKELEGFEIIDFGETSLCSVNFELLGIHPANLIQIHDINEEAASKLVKHIDTKYLSETNSKLFKYKSYDEHHLGFKTALESFYSIFEGAKITLGLVRDKREGETKAESISKTFNPDTSYIHLNN